MSSVAMAIAYALFVWWFSTGLVFLLVLRSRRGLRWSLAVAGLLVPGSLYLLAWSSTDAGIWGAYAGFTAAILMWGAQEIGFLTGFVTGPRPRPCPEGLALPRRALYAAAAIIYHEAALVVSGIAMVLVTGAGVNQIGDATFLILWVMRLSAKLNLFLGVPVLNDEAMPDKLAYLRSYFVRGRITALFPIAMGLAVAAIGGLIAHALSAETAAVRVRDCLLFTLLALAVLEHGFMLVRLPVDALWRWSTRRRPSSAHSELERREEPAHRDSGAPHDTPAVQPQALCHSNLTSI